MPNKPDRKRVAKMYEQLDDKSRSNMGPGTKKQYWDERFSDGSVSKAGPVVGAFAQAYRDQAKDELNKLKKGRKNAK